MGTSTIRLMRRAVGLAWVALFACILAVVGVTHLAPATGHQAFIIRGGSMAPAVPLGSLILTSPVDPAQIGVGDVLTITSDNGVVYTHRVAGIVERDGGRSFQLKGDANRTPDHDLVPARAVIGRLAVAVPFAGYLLAALTLPSGVLSFMSMLGALLLAYWLLEDLEPVPEPDVPHAGTEPDAPGPDTAPDPQVA